MRKTRMFVLLLKRGVAFVEECMDGEEFAAAQRNGAGILGVFESPEEAAEFMQHRLRPGIVTQLTLLRDLPTKESHADYSS